MSSAELSLIVIVGLCVVVLCAVILMHARAAAKNGAVMSELARKFADRMVADHTNKLQVLEMEQQAEVASIAAKSRAAERARAIPGIPDDDFARIAPEQNGEVQ